MPGASEILWFVPVFARGTSNFVLSHPMTQGYAANNTLHVNWSFEAFPATARCIGVTVTGSSSYVGTPLPPVLKETQGSWAWESLFCGEQVVNGAQLTIAVPFSRDFPFWDVEAETIAHYIIRYDLIKCWIKFRIGNPANLSSIRLGLSDSNTSVPPGHLPFFYNRNYLNDATPGNWFMAYLERKFTSVDDPLWDNANMRFNTVFQGPTTLPLGVPPHISHVEVEHIAIDLSEPRIVEVPPP